MATLLIGLLVALLLKFTGFASGACDGMAGTLGLLGDTTRLITGILYLEEKREIYNSVGEQGEHMQCDDNRALTSHQCCPGSNPGVNAYTTSCYQEKLKKQMK